MGCRLSLVFFHFLLQFRHFTASSQEIAVIFVGAAADRAAWNEKLTVQSHHADGVPVLFADCRRVVKAVHDDDPSQERGRHRAVFVITAHKAVREADDARLFQDPGVLELLRPAEAAQRQKRRSSRFLALEHFDHALCRLRVLCHYILNIAAESYLDSRLILFVCF